MLARLHPGEVGDQVVELFLAEETEEREHVLSVVGAYEPTVRPEIREEQLRVPAAAGYEFKHALVQDTAYDSLLRSRRRQLHDQVASVLIDRFPAEMQTQPETLARHCEAAGRNAEAVDFYKTAGERAVARSANVEAIAAFRRALSLLALLEQVLR